MVGSLIVALQPAYDECLLAEGSKIGQEEVSVAGR